MWSEKHESEQMGLVGPGGRRGIGFGVNIGVQQGGSCTGLINQQDRSMQGIGADRCIMKGIRTMRNDGNTKKMLNRLCGPQKEQRRIVEKRSFGKSKIQELERKLGIRYSAGSNKGISSFESEQGLAEIYQFHVQRACIQLFGPTFWLELKSNAFLQGDQANSQSYQSKVLCQNGTINERSTDLVIGKETTRVRHGSDNSIHEGVGLENVDIQIQSNINQRLSIPWLEVEYLFEDNTHSSGQEKVIDVKDEKMIRDYD
ncbi:MAG: hypothetical protein EZS28_019459 [Streblomastix strix]|uniref:Uncharacterized protein n=1 Tax=Streblomastix strix TaxID=222440 RepID=A0A5J4VRT3_9EUKA|nr:MAG: hypothetical protein EZS28_019459 [Streblomastix strix]